MVGEWMRRGTKFPRSAENERGKKKSIWEAMNSWKAKVGCVGAWPKSNWYRKQFHLEISNNKAANYFRNEGLIGSIPRTRDGEARRTGRNGPGLPYGRRKGALKYAHRSVMARQPPYGSVLITGQGDRRGGVLLTRADQSCRMGPSRLPSLGLVRLVYQADIQDASAPANSLHDCHLLPARSHICSPPLFPSPNI